MEAVASKAVMPKALKIELSIVKAILNPPPAILDTISIAANRPLNVRFNLSAVLSLIINCVVNLWNAAIALNSYWIKYISKTGSYTTKYFYKRFTYVFK